MRVIVNNNHLEKARNGIEERSIEQNRREKYRTIIE